MPRRTGEGDGRRVAVLFLRPGADAIVGDDQVRRDEDGVVAVGDAADVLAFLRVLPPVPAPIVGAQRVGEGSRGRGEEGWRKGLGRAFGEKRISGLEVEGRRGGFDGVVDGG